MDKKAYQHIDDYISEFPDNVAEILTQIRSSIQKAAPKARESISYNMPAFRQDNKVLVYFAAYKNHIGFYALPSGNEAFQKELSPYKTGKGSIQFPLDEKMPFGLISKMVIFRIKEIESEKAAPKL